jgi:Domain of unknown function (DUF4148)
MKTLSFIVMSSAVLFAISGNVSAEDGHGAPGAAPAAKSRAQVRAELVEAENDGLIFVKSRDYPLDALKVTHSTEVYDGQAARMSSLR